MAVPCTSAEAYRLFPRCITYVHIHLHRSGKGEGPRRHVPVNAGQYVLDMYVPFASCPHRQCLLFNHSYNHGIHPLLVSQCRMEARIRTRRYHLWKVCAVSSVFRTNSFLIYVLCFSHCPDMVFDYMSKPRKPSPSLNC